MGQYHETCSLFLGCLCKKSITGIPCRRFQRALPCCCQFANIGLSDLDWEVEFLREFSYKERISIRGLAPQVMIEVGYD